jgi:hypothetical protein
MQITSQIVKNLGFVKILKNKFRLCQVTLQLQPLFKRSISYVVKKDTDLGDQVASFGRQHEFADITWYPSQGKAVYRIDDRISSNTSGNGLYDYIPFRSTPSLGLAVVRATGLLLYCKYKENMCYLYTNRSLKLFLCRAAALPYE